MGLLKKSNAQELFDAYKGAQEALKREQENARKERERLAMELKLEQERERRRVQAARRKLTRDFKKQLFRSLVAAFDGHNATILNSNDTEIVSDLESLGFSICTFSDECTIAERERTRILSKTIEAKNAVIVNQLNNLKYESETQLARMTKKPESWVRTNLISHLFKDIEKQITTDNSDALSSTLKTWVTLPSGRYVEAKKIFVNCAHLQEMCDLSFNESFVTRFSYYALLLARALDSKRQVQAENELLAVKHRVLMNESDTDLAEINNDVLVSWRNPHSVSEPDEINAQFLLWIASPVGQEFTRVFNELVDGTSKLQKKKFVLDPSIFQKFEDYVPSITQITKALELMEYKVQVINDELQVSFE